MSERNPMQPVLLDQHGRARFKSNKIVDALLEFASKRGMDLNTIAMMQFTQDDREQFAQLIGYSVIGFHELSYVSDETAKVASDAANKLGPNLGGCRDDGCEWHIGVERE